MGKRRRRRRSRRKEEEKEEKTEREEKEEGGRRAEVANYVKCVTDFDAHKAVNKTYTRESSSVLAVTGIQVRPCI